MKISGKTRLCFIFGWPIEHVRTPQAFNALVERRGIDCVMAPLLVEPANLELAFAQLRVLENVSGAVITLPHKQNAWSLCDLHTQSAEQCRAVNVVRRRPDGRLEGDMLDGAGFVAGMELRGISVRGLRVLLAGAGGAARAIAFALGAAGASEIAVHNRTAAHADSLVARLKWTFPEVKCRSANGDPSGFDLVVNATPLGMKPDDPPPVNVAGLGPGMVVAEAVMEPQKTRLLRLAEAAGARVLPGHAMLEGQLELIADVLGAA